MEMSAIIYGATTYYERQDPPCGSGNRQKSVASPQRRAEWAEPNFPERPLFVQQVSCINQFFDFS